MKLLSSIVFSSLLVACVDSATPTGASDPGDDPTATPPTTVVNQRTVEAPEHCGSGPDAGTGSDAGSDGGSGSTIDAGSGSGSDGGTTNDASSGRAYGVSINAVSLAGIPIVTVPATPDTNVENPATIVNVPLGVVNDGVFNVSNVATSGDGFIDDLADINRAVAVREPF